MARMNATAARLGMTRTKFVQRQRPAGARAGDDRARSGQAGARPCVRDYPEHAHLWSMVDCKVGKRRLRTHNGLLTNYEGADGLKTGFICDSGFNVVATATREGRKLIAVVLGEPTGRRAHRARRQPARARLPDLRLEGAVRSAEPGYACRWPLDAKGPMTMRQAVISFECGTGRRRAVAKKKGGKPKAVVARGATRPEAGADGSEAKAPKAARSAASSAAQAIAALPPVIRKPRRSRAAAMERRPGSRQLGPG